VAGAISSGNSINYAYRTMHPASGVSIANCSDGSKLLDGDTLPTGYTITASAVTAGTTAKCTLAPPTAGNIANTTFTVTGT
jgi:hypothetical protein